MALYQKRRGKKDESANEKWIKANQEVEKREVAFAAAVGKASANKQNSHYKQPHTHLPTYQFLVICTRYTMSLNEVDLDVVWLAKSACGGYVCEGKRLTTCCAWLLLVVLAFCCCCSGLMLALEYGDVKAGCWLAAKVFEVPAATTFDVVIVVGCG